MVGVAGRSKACGNCRGRHIRCDEKRPECGRCIKAKLKCDGYRDLTVIQYGQDKAGQELKLVPYKSNSKPTKPTTPAPPNGGFSHAFDFNDRYAPFLSLPIDLDDVFKNYTHERLLRGNENNEFKGDALDRTLSDKCFLALATAYFGYDQREKRLYERGLTRYGNALTELHTALSHPVRSKSYDVLESVLLMELFETLMSDKKDGWVAHALGLQRMFEMRGPEAFQQMPERQVLQVSRPSIIFACLVLRQPSILAREEWKTVPWSIDVVLKNGQLVTKSTYEYLVDICTACPGLLWTKDQALALVNRDERYAALGAFVTAVKAALDQLQIWKQYWDIIELEHATEIPAKPEPPRRQDGEPAWMTAYYLSSVEQANTYTLYYATYIHFRRMLNNIEHPMNEFPAIDDSVYEAGIEICRCVQYHLQKAREGEGSFTIMFALRMAWEAVSDVDVNIGHWLQDVLQGVGAATMGRWAVAGYLLDLEEMPQTPKGRVDVIEIVDPKETEIPPR